MSLKKKLLKIRDEKNIRWDVLEKDYVQSWVIAAIGQHDKLSDSMIFKGGTCLKKVWFKDYRYSEDLDFTEVKKMTDQQLEQYLYECFELAKE